MLQIPWRGNFFIVRNGPGYYPQIGCFGNSLYTLQVCAKTSFFSMATLWAGYLHFRNATSPREIVLLPDILLECMHILGSFSIKCEEKKEEDDTSKGQMCLPARHWQIFQEFQKLSSPTSPPDGTTFISCKFGDQTVPLALFANLATRWHHRHELQIYQPG